MRHPLLVATVCLSLGSLAACGSPPTKTVRTTTTTTTVDESGNASAEAHSELRTHVPVIGTSNGPIMSPSAPAVPYGTQQTIEQSSSTDVDGTTTTRKRVTNY